MWRVAKYLGTAVAFAFIALLLWQYAGQIPALNWSSPRVLSGLGLGLLFYVLSQIIGGMAWRSCLAIYNIHPPRGVAESQLLVSQIGKYIPGNVAQFLGRAELARTDGIGGATIAGALTLEIGFLFLAGSLVVASVFWLSPELLTQLGRAIPDHRLMLAVGFVAVLIPSVVAAQVMCWRMAGRPRLVASRLVAPVMLHMVNFAVLGVSLWFVARVTEPSTGLSIDQSIAIFAVAWVAGFVMPGAPGGVGVRDGIITLGLGLFLGAGAALGAALLHRAISVLGDVIVFAVGLVLRNTFCGPQSQHS